MVMSLQYYSATHGTTCETDALGHAVRIDGGATAPTGSNATAVRVAANTAEKIIARLKEPFVIDGNIIHSSASVGVAVYGVDTPDAEQEDPRARGCRPL